MNNEEKILRKTIASTFRLNGLIIKSDACGYLCEQLLPISETMRDTWLSNVVDFLQRKQTLHEPIVDLNLATSAMRECCQSKIDNTGDMIRVISAFDVPRFEYNVDSKRFYKSTKKSSSNNGYVLADWASAKSAMFRNRYTVLKQRLDRHELLSGVGDFNRGDNLIDDDDESRPSSPKLRTIDRLLCSTSEQQGDDTTVVIVFGMLSQLKEGKYYLEDPTGILPIDLTNVVYHPGLFVENSFVLAEGVYVDGLLRVNGLAHPPPESSKVSRMYYDNANTFGGPSEISSKYSERMSTLERENPDNMIVFLADVFLDRAGVVEKLRTLFYGFNEDLQPVAIVMMGNFLADFRNDEYADKLATKLDQLADVINEYENLAKDTLFVIVPGPADSPSANVVPRPPLPEYISGSFVKKVAKSLMTTNPCRIQYCTREIVVIREDLVVKMCRNCINTPEPTTVSVNFAKTILCQSFLIALPLNVCPVYCTADNSLYLYPLPDLVVVADGITDPFVEKYKDTVVVNPSSFSKRKFVFKVYVPESNQIEDSQVPDND